eukprot:scaffold1647_cov162-Pinguiococcus_pyrenoidosus.AAC.1
MSSLGDLAETAIVDARRRQSLAVLEQIKRAQRQLLLHFTAWRSGQHPATQRLHRQHRSACADLGVGLRRRAVGAFPRVCVDEVD